MVNTMRLDHLEPEVLAMILEYVHDTSRRTSLAVALTCKYLASVMKLISYRHRTLRIKGSDSQGLQTLPDVIQKWSKDDMFLINIRTLTVEGHLPAIPRLEETLEDQDLWQPLVDLLSRISKLRLLTWNLAAVPISVLDAFHTHQPFAKLRLFKYQPSLDLQPSKRDKALARSPALTHLRSALTAQSMYPNPNMQETAFRRIVALAPLEYVGIVNHIGDPIAGEPQRKIPFRTSQKPNSSIRFLTLDGYSISKSMLEDWSSIVDLTALESVKCSRGLPELSYFEHATSMLPNLKHVSLNFRQIIEPGEVDANIIDAVQHYLTTCPPLESLSLWSWISVVDLKGVLERHGPTLKSLQLHERESIHRHQLRRTLTVDQLRDVLKSCPKLKELTFDLNRQKSALDLYAGDSNLEYVTVLEGTKLNYLQIYLDQGLSHNFYSIYDDDEDDSSEEDNEDNEEDEQADDETANVQEAAAEAKADGVGNNGNFTRTSRDGEPSSKRLKRSNTSSKPSTEDDMRSYVESIWKKVFATSMTSRRLDVKFGEWETISGRRGASWTLIADNDRENARYFKARPAERDDQRGQCTITMKKP